MGFLDIASNLLQNLAGAFGQGSSGNGGANPLPNLFGGPSPGGADPLSALFGGHSSGGGADPLGAILGGRASGGADPLGALASIVSSHPKPAQQYQESQKAIATATQAQQARAQAGGTVSNFAAFAPEQQATAKQIVQMAVSQYGPSAGPVVAAILQGENGLGGATGDNNQSFGPFQFYAGGQLPGFAQAKNVDLATAGQLARAAPLDAAQWALSPQGYLGQALGEGTRLGLDGERLLQRALQAQNSGALAAGSPEYARYQQALQQQMAAPMSGGNPPVNQSAQGFLAEAEKLRGVPYAWGGTTASGVDCSGLVIVAAQASGHPLQGRPTAQGIYNQTARVDPSAVQAGDLVFFTGPGAGPGETIGHVGIVTQNGIMLNAPEPGRNVDYANYNSAYWAPKIVGYGRLN